MKPFQYLVPVLAILSMAPVSASATQTATAQQYGALGDGQTDDWWAIQQGLDDLSAHGGGTLSLPPTASNSYVIRQSLRMRSNVIINVPQPDTRVLCKSNYTNHGKLVDATGVDIRYVTRFSLNGCIEFGSVVTSDNEAELRNFTVDPQAQPGAWVHLPKPGQIAALKAGDLVITASATNFMVGSEPVPTWGEMDRIEEIDVPHGRIRLRYSAVKGEPISVLKPLMTRDQFWLRTDDDTTANRSIGLPIWASWRAGIQGGTWIAQTDAGAPLPFTTGGGSLDCVLKPHKVVAQHGTAYGNLFSHCQIAVDREETSMLPVEIAYLSSDNQVAIKSIVLENGTPSSDWVVGIDEEAHSNSVVINALSIQNPTVKNIIDLNTTSQNTISIGSLTGMPVAQSIVFMDNVHFAGVRSPTENNTVTITQSSVPPALNYIMFAGDGVRNNKISGSSFAGLPPGRTSVFDNTQEIGNSLENVAFQ